MLCYDILSVLPSGQVPHAIISCQLFWNLKDPVLVQTLSYNFNYNFFLQMSLQQIIYDNAE